jgi:hypothetical protein
VLHADIDGREPGEHECSAHLGVAVAPLPPNKNK